MRLARATIAIRARRIGGFIVIARRSMTILRNGIKRLSDIYYIGAASIRRCAIGGNFSNSTSTGDSPGRGSLRSILSLLAAFVPPRARRYLRPSFVSTLRAGHKPAQIFTVFQREINATSFFFSFAAFSFRPRDLPGTFHFGGFDISDSF